MTVDGAATTPILKLTPAATSARPEQVRTDQIGRIEVRGIDRIPEEERHGRARELFAVWAASNVTYLYIVLGGAMILLGMNVWQAMLVVFVGNLFWLAVGLLAISGPVSGTPSSVIMRTMFGVRGNRINVGLISWVIAVAYEAINLSVSALAGFALVDEVGLHANTEVKVAIVLITSAVTLVISVYGHATIVRFSGWFTIGLSICVVVLGYFVVRHMNLHYAPAAAYALHGGALWAVAFVGLTIIASSPLSWATGADYARYLPASTSPRAVAWWTIAGGFLPAVFLGWLGVLAGTAVDMSDPQTSLKAILPSWFYPIFLLVIVIGSITNNVLTAYSSGLSLQAVGIPWRRSITVLFDGLFGAAICCYALFISNFLDTLNNLLALTVAILGPGLAIYGADLVMRRNRYDGHELHDEGATGPFWYHRGFNWAGVTAQVVGTIVAFLCVDTTIYVGPIAHALDGADLSAIVGPLVGGVLYVALMKTLYARQLDASSSPSRAGTNA